MNLPSLLRNRNFLLLWIGYFINLTGSNIYRIAILWWTLQKTGLALKMGILMIISILPMILIGPFAGVFVDRWNRKNVMAACYLLNGLIVLVVATLEFKGSLQLGHLYLSAILLASLFAFVGTANFSILPQIVPKEQIVQANALQEFSINGSTILGASLGGVLIGIAGISWAFLTNGLLTLIFGGLVLLIRLSPQTPVKKAGIFSQMKEGFQYLRKERTLLGIMIVLGLVDLAAFPIFILLPIFADRIFGVGPQGLGWMEAAAGAGAIVATLILFRFSQHNWRYLILQLSLIMMGILFVLAGLPIRFFVFLSLLGAMGFFLGLINIQTFSHFQIQVPASFLGRITSLLNTMLLSLQPISYGVGGYLGDLLGARTMMILCGAGILIGATLFALIPKIRHI